MSEHSDEFRRCLVGLDVAGIRALWATFFPHADQPKNDRQALVTLHMARTQAKSLTLRQRAYSHRWLIEQGYPSALPDELKPQAERLYPKVVTAVGLSVNFTAKELKPAAKQIEKVMAEAIMNLYVDGEERPAIVKKIMMEAGAKERKKLFG